MKENIENLIQSFRSRNIDAVYAETADEALRYLLSEFESGKTVSWGGSMTISQLGIKERLADCGLNVIDRDHAANPEEKHRMQQQTFYCDYYLMSSNAVTRDGILINIDGIGNRVAALIYGPARVFVVVGRNKICDTEAEALNRVRNIAAPKNAARLSRETPCVDSGVCHDCLEEQSICSHIVITRRSWHKGRITVVLVDEELGV